MYCGSEMDHQDSFYGFSDFLLASDHFHLEGPTACLEVSFVKNQRPFFESVAVQEYY